jgi:8-oxo-dGTP diphosphatase
VAQRREQPQHPTVGIGVIIRNRGRVLVGKRRGGLGAGSWGVPGGQLELFESWDDCARREVREETGLELGALRYVAATNDVFVAEHQHYVTVYLESETNAEPGNPSPRETVRWEWHSWDALPTPVFASLENLRRTGYRPGGVGVTREE